MLENLPLVVALGNPGYANTIHNIGTDIILEMLVKYPPIKILKRNTSLSLIVYDWGAFWLLTCPDYMNISGVKTLKLYKSLNASKLLVILDDLDTRRGDIKLKYATGANGHNGMRSIIREFQIINMNFSLNCMRILVGVDRPNDNTSIKDYVLSKYYLSPEQKNTVIEKLYHCLFNQISKIK